MKTYHVEQKATVRRRWIIEAENEQEVQDIIISGEMTPIEEYDMSTSEHIEEIVQ